MTHATLDDAEKSLEERKLPLESSEQSSEEATKRRQVCKFPIPVQFTLSSMVGSDYKSTPISTGDDENENQAPGESCTRFPTSHVFEIDGTVVRIIDTPGIGDTRGYDQDKKNFQSTLKHLAQLNELHGIVILLKSHNARLEVTFRFCIKELLTNLHIDAPHNIVFCFTNSRGTSFLPGDTMVPLKTLLEANKVDIPLTKDNLYCTDNEAVRYLATIGSGIGCKESDLKVVADSWNKSADENERLLRHVMSRRPHPVKQMLAVHESRQMVLGLARALAEITNSIEETLTAINVARQTGDACGVPYVETRKIPFDCTQEVCTSSRCMVYVKEGNEGKIQYNCIAKYVADNLSESESKCPKCECAMGVHAIITYRTVNVLTCLPDLNGSSEDHYGESKHIEDGRENDAKEKNFQNLDKLSEELISEELVITKKRAQFSCFLKMNALKKYNDEIGEYLEFFIRSRTDQADEKTLNNLKIVREKYQNEFEILCQAMTDPRNNVDPLKSDDIQQLVDDLYSLKHVGLMLRKLTDEPGAENTNDIGKYNRVNNIDIDNRMPDETKLNNLQKLFRERNGELQIK